MATYGGSGQTLTRDEVIGLYTELLGRTPSNAEIDAQLSAVGSAAALRQQILDSDEYARRRQQSETGANPQRGVDPRSLRYLSAYDAAPITSKRTLTPEEQRELDRLNRELAEADADSKRLEGDERMAAITRAKALAGQRSVLVSPYIKPEWRVAAKTMEGGKSIAPDALPDASTWVRMPDKTPDIFLDPVTGNVYRAVGNQKFQLVDNLASERFNDTQRAIYLRVTELTRQGLVKPPQPIAGGREAGGRGWRLPPNVADAYTQAMRAQGLDPLNIDTGNPKALDALLSFQLSVPWIKNTNDKRNMGLAMWAAAALGGIPAMAGMLGSAIGSEATGSKTWGAVIGALTSMGLGAAGAGNTGLAAPLGAAAGTAVGGGAAGAAASGATQAAVSEAVKAAATGKISWEALLNVLAGAGGGALGGATRATNPLLSALSKLAPYLRGAVGVGKAAQSGAAAGAREALGRRTSQAMMAQRAGQGANVFEAFGQAKQRQAAMQGAARQRQQAMEAAQRQRTALVEQNRQRAMAVARQARERFSTRMDDANLRRLVFGTEAPRSAPSPFPASQQQTMNPLARRARPRPTARTRGTAPYWMGRRRV